MRREDVQSLILAARELGLSWREAGALMRDVTVEARKLKGLWRRGPTRSPLIALGVALIAFPEPIISDIVGWTLIVSGLIGSRIRPPPIYVEDVIETANVALMELRKASSIGLFNGWLLQQD
ncbi:MAG: hypothetical protein QXH67_02920 [Candidatus Bathyarchaeia archaeon]